MSAFLNVFGVILNTWIGRWLFKKAYRGKVFVLVYHNPSLEIVKQHFSYLEKIGTILSASRCRLYDPSEVNSRAPNFVFTFDDGYHGYLEIATFFERMNIKPVMYITTGMIDTNREFWWNIVRSRSAAAGLKSLSEYEKLEYLKSEYNWDIETEFEYARNLTSENLRAISKSAIVAAHTSTHPILSRCDAEQGSREIADSVRFLEGLLGQKIHHFAYPNGGKGDFGIREVEILKSVGIANARTTTYGFLGPVKEKDSDYHIPGVLISDNSSLNELFSRLVGIRFLIKKIVKCLHRK